MGKVAERRDCAYELQNLNAVIRVQEYRLEA
jgi:hypothetical protein